jgi:3-methyladenine DNA glycosylase AlkD
MTLAAKQRSARQTSSSKRSPKPSAAPARKVKALEKPRVTSKASPNRSSARVLAGESTVQVAKRLGARELAAEVKSALAALEAQSDARILREMGPRYGIHTAKAFGVSVAKIRELAKRIGRSHDLAAALWATGWYEARMLACFVEDPAQVSPAQMERWCKDFDNWAICDTACFHLFDHTPHAFEKVEAWAGRRDEFVKRAAFALLASLALHDKAARSEAFVRCLPLIEKAATDPRNFVKKAVNWALRAVGQKRPELSVRARALAQRLASSADATARWVGKGALRELSSVSARKGVAARAKEGAEPR